MFEATRRRRYCSNACNVRAWRRKKAADSAPAPVAESLQAAGGQLSPAAASRPAGPTGGRLPRRFGVAAATTDLRRRRVESAGDELDVRSAAWWESELAIANLSASLARLRAASALGLHRSLEATDFERAGHALHDALARQDALLTDRRSRLASAVDRLRALHALNAAPKN